ncbi:MAG: 16S rRNA (guanine(966)-N(2))-methyltransferase RsmD [Myxococcales bacterium]|nr:16S rRNA (guanine(966)-N(2))-methyltransferase RsmD [Myxococcales bacterium]
MRVIGGSLRSRRLRPPPHGVRPTTDRVRESIFAALGDVGGARVLDLFAGSGALGIEALSRGAEHATFVDVARASIACVRRNLDDLGLVGLARVEPGDALRALRTFARRGERFDLVFLDPPYDAGLYEPALAALAAEAILAPGGLAVVERARRSPLEASSLVGYIVERERAYGDTAVDLLRTHDGDGSPDASEKGA